MIAFSTCMHSCPFLLLHIKRLYTLFTFVCLWSSSNTIIISHSLFQVHVLELNQINSVRFIYKSVRIVDSTVLLLLRVRTSRSHKLLAVDTTNSETDFVSYVLIQRWGRSAKQCPPSHRLLFPGLSLLLGTSNTV